MFIRVELDAALCAGAKECAECVSVCPVNVFRIAGGAVETDEGNEDECTLCELCIERCTRGALRIIKTYES